MTIAELFILVSTNSLHLDVIFGNWELKKKKRKKKYCFMSKNCCRSSVTSYGSIVDTRRVNMDSEILSPAWAV